MVHFCHKMKYVPQLAVPNCFFSSPSHGPSQPWLQEENQIRWHQTKESCRLLVALVRQVICLPWLKWAVVVSTATICTEIWWPWWKMIHSSHNLFWCLSPSRGSMWYKQSCCLTWFFMPCGQITNNIGKQCFRLEARMHCSAFGSILLPTLAWLASEASMNNGKLAHCHSLCMAMLCQQLAVVRFGQSFYKPIPGAACWPEEQLKREACTFGVLLGRTWSMVEKVPLLFFPCFEVELHCFTDWEISKPWLERKKICRRLSRACFGWIFFGRRPLWTLGFHSRRPGVACICFGLTQVEPQSRGLQCLQRCRWRWANLESVQQPYTHPQLGVGGSTVAQLGKAFQVPIVQHPLPQCLQCHAGLPSPEIFGLWPVSVWGSFLSSDPLLAASWTIGQLTVLVAEDQALVFCVWYKTQIPPFQQTYNVCSKSWPTQVERQGCRSAWTVQYHASTLARAHEPQPWSP